MINFLFKLNRLMVISLVLFAVAAEAQDTTQKIVTGRFNSTVQQEKPYVILISADGFRWDLADKYQAENLQKLRSAGVQADYMKPSFPSLTFPNHYTIVTGMYPSHHGLVNNTFFDPARKQLYRMSNRDAVEDSSWYGGKPLWVLAEQQQMVSASFYWVGSETAVQGVRPTYYYNFNEAISIDKRINVVKDWLKLPADKRPHLITFYFPEVDHAEHIYGPDSKETEEAVHFVDQSVAKMVRTVDSLGLNVNYVFVSDHGMTSVDFKNTIPMPKAIDTAKFIVPAGDALVHLYAKDPGDIKPTYRALKAEAKDYDVYLAKKMPKRWHYSKRDDAYNRIGDIILVPHLPRVFNLAGKNTTPGKHGFDPELQDMHAVFYAWGPLFRNGLKITGFENVHVYPLIAHMLGLTYNHHIDGDIKILKPVLK